MITLKVVEDVYALLGREDRAEPVGEIQQEQLMDGEEYGLYLKGETYSSEDSSCGFVFGRNIPWEIRNFACGHEKITCYVSSERGSKFVLERIQ
jgi:hypothetical protein